MTSDTLRQRERELRLVTPDGDCYAELVMLAYRLRLKRVEDLDRVIEETGGEEPR